MLSPLVRVKFGLQRAHRLLRDGQGDVLADALLSRLLPQRNPVLNWDRFHLLSLAPDVTRARLLRPTAPPTRAGDEEIARLAAQHPELASQFRQRVARGHECWLFQEGGRITARHWLIIDPAEVQTNSGYRFLPPARPAVWGYDMYIDPAYRLRGHFVSFMENAARARDGGPPPHVFVEVHFRNDRSLTACRRFGFQLVRTVDVWTTLGVRTYVARDPAGARAVTRRYGFDVPPRL